MSSSASQRAITFVLGGARSGKSRHAEELIAAAAKARRTRPLYIATAEPRDSEMQSRILAHRERRGPEWDTLEEPFDLPGALAANRDRIVMVDCLTLWLTNLMLADRNVAAERAKLIARLGEMRAPVALIANEVGLGIVPGNALARAFRDEAGILNQAVAAAANQVVFMAAGLSLVMKDDAASASRNAAE